MNPQEKTETQKVAGNVVFKNEPKLSEHEADKSFNERRLKLAPLVKDFISNHEMFKGKEVSVTFAQKGVSSLLCIIETPDEKMVLKIPLSRGFSEGEAQFLKAWEKAGVKVPHVFETGTISESPYTLMEYVDAPVLTDAYSDEECIEKGVYEEMGKTLRAMHEPEAEGYGRVIDGKAEYKEFKDWILGPDMKKRIEYVEEHELLNDEEHGSIEDVIEILLDFVEKNKKSSYCHDDFGGSNIFATHPITVFDPNPRFNHGYLDLGRSLMNHITVGKTHGVLSRIIEGYFEGKSYDKKVLHACIFLNSLMKMPYKHKTKSLNVIKNLQDYLAENKDLLEK